VISADSPEELAARIRTAHQAPSDGSPALASSRSYQARATQFRALEETAGGRLAEDAGRGGPVAALV
jgi:hypothetical protein